MYIERRNTTQKVIFSKHWDQSHSKAVNLAVYEWWHMFMAFLCPDISKIENANIFFLSNNSNNNTLLVWPVDHKNVRNLFIRTSFCLVIIGTVWHLFLNFEIKKPKSGFWIILHITENFSKIHPWKSKIRKSEHDTQILF